MNKIKTTDIKSTVIDTVRNLKKKRSNVSEESAGSNNKISSLNNVDQDSTPTVTRSVVDTRIVSKTHTVVNSASYKTLTKKRKITSPETDIQIANNETTSSMGDANRNNNRAGVFDRLANKNYTQLLKAQRKEVKDLPINFFDTQFHQPCLNLLDVIITNGRKIKELLGDYEIAPEKITRGLSSDQHFMICFKAHLTEMQKLGEIMKELKSISKPVFLKLETFLLEKIQAKIEFESMDSMIQKHVKKAEQLTKTRMNQLKERLKGADYLM